MENQKQSGAALIQPRLVHRPRDLETVDRYAKIAGPFLSVMPAPPMVAGAAKRLMQDDVNMAKEKILSMNAEVRHGAKDADFD